uniref:C2H2-type domain-containing protein n=1 Tax=Timema douglasi TaxID=61478 RepID=A0A7R8V8G6_TIMDO|nr:unnamed protein product [Timema douglasi]
MRNNTLAIVFLFLSGLSMSSCVSMPNHMAFNTSQLLQHSALSTQNELIGMGRKRNTNELFPCVNCGRLYQWKKTLLRHIRLECGKEPQFQCPYCPKKTKIKTETTISHTMHTVMIKGDVKLEVNKLFGEIMKGRKVVANLAFLNDWTLEDFGSLYVSNTTTGESNKGETSLEANKVYPCRIVISKQFLLQYHQGNLSLLDDWSQDNFCVIKSPHVSNLTDEMQTRAIYPQGKEVYPCRIGRVENHLGENPLSTPHQDSNLDLPIICSLVYCRLLRPRSHRSSFPEARMQGRCGAQPEYRQSMSLVLVRSMTQYLESRQSLFPGWLRLNSVRTQRIFPQRDAARIDDRDSCFHDRPHALRVLSIDLAYGPSQQQVVKRIVEENPRPMWYGEVEKSQLADSDQGQIELYGSPWFVTGSGSDDDTWQYPSFHQKLTEGAYITPINSEKRVGSENKTRAAFTVDKKASIENHAFLVPKPVCMESEEEPTKRRRVRRCSDNIFQCSRCLKVYRYQRSLQTHMKLECGLNKQILDCLHGCRNSSKGRSYDYRINIAIGRYFDVQQKISLKHFTNPEEMISNVFVPDESSFGISPFGSYFPCDTQERQFLVPNITCLMALYIVAFTGVKFWKSLPEHCLQFNHQDEVTDDTTHFMSSLQEYGPRAVKDNYDKSDTLSLLIDSQNVSYKHTSLKCFVCPKCARIYQRKQSLYLHQKHECGKEPQFVCPYCTYRAKLKGNLVRHIATKHEMKMTCLSEASIRDMQSTKDGFIPYNYQCNTVSFTKNLIKKGCGAHKLDLAGLKEEKRIEVEQKKQEQENKDEIKPNPKLEFPKNKHPPLGESDPDYIAHCGFILDFSSNVNGEQWCVLMCAEDPYMALVSRLFALSKVYMESVNGCRTSLFIAIVALGVKFWKSPPQHCLQLNSQSETTWDTSHFMSSLQKNGFGAINDSVVPESSYKPPPKQCFVCPQCARIYQRKESLYLHQKHECGKEPQFVCPYCTYRAKLKGNLRKCILPGSNPDLPIFGSLVSYESCVLDHAATELGNTFWKSSPQHGLQLNSQCETTWDTSCFMSSLQGQGFGAINDSVVPESSYKPPPKQCFGSDGTTAVKERSVRSSVISLTKCAVIGSDRDLKMTVYLYFLLEEPYSILDVPSIGATQDKQQHRRMAERVSTTYPTSHPSICKFVPAIKMEQSLNEVCIEQYTSGQEPPLQRKKYRNSMERLSSSMASLVLTDSSQMTAEGFEKLPDQIMYPYAEPYDLQKHTYLIPQLVGLGSRGPLRVTPGVGGREGRGLSSVQGELQLVVTDALDRLATQAGHKENVYDAVT